MSHIITQIVKKILLIDEDDGTQQEKDLEYLNIKNFTTGKKGIAKEMMI